MEPTQSWASQLASWLHANPIEDAHEHLYGLYAALRLDSDGAGMAVTDLLGGGSLYHSENARWFALSNRAGLAAAAAVGFESVPERDPLAMGWLVFWDSTLADDSGYWDATRLVFNHLIAFGPNGAAHIEKRPHPFWHRPGPNPTSGDYASMLDELDADLRAELRTIARLPVDDFELRLSGGKDSRMLAALLHDEGLADRFRFHTYGHPEHADVIGARLVAEKLGLRWTFEARTGIPAAQEARRLHRHTFLVEGFTNGWDSTGIPIPERGVSLSGVGGECTIFGRTSTAGINVQTVDEVKALYAVKDNFDEFKMLLPDVRQHYHRVVDDWVDTQAADGNEPNRISSLFITQQRTRCWAGPSLALKPSLWLGPFLTSVLHPLSAASADGRPRQSARASGYAAPLPGRCRHRSPVWRDLAGGRHRQLSRRGAASRYPAVTQPARRAKWLADGVFRRAQADVANLSGRPVEPDFRGGRL